MLLAMAPWRYTLTTMMPWIALAFFFFAVGACVGSLTNVLVYRMPLGLDVIFPASRCPKCETKLSWKDNIPIFGWIFLRGRCRYCKSRISPEYPLVELLVACLFLAFFILWYGIEAFGWLGADGRAMWLGVDWASIRPEWARNGLGATWPEFVVLLVLVGSLVAMTLVDAKTFTIPLAIPWFATVVGVVFHVGHAAWMQWQGQGGGWRYTAEVAGADGYAWDWAIANARSWWGVGAGLGGVAGLGLGLLLIRTGVIKRSFLDYEAWEKQALAEMKAQRKAPAGGEPDEGEGEGQATEGEEPRGGVLLTTALVLGSVVGLTTIVALIAPAVGWPLWYSIAAGVVGGPILGAILTRILNRGRSPAAEEASKGEPEGGAEMWIQYPHARREMVREMAFLAPAAVLGWAGAMGLAWLATKQGWGVAGGEPPLVLKVLGGVLLGYLIGGAVVWGVRIFGSIAFGKEAMGLGDVHLMAAVGACLGWIDATVAFFAAAFVGIFWVIVSNIASGRLSRAMPYGPYLAVATILVVLCKPLVEWGLGRMFAMPVNIP